MPGLATGVRGWAGDEADERAQALSLLVVPDADADAAAHLAAAGGGGGAGGEDGRAAGGAVWGAAALLAGGTAVEVDAATGALRACVAAGAHGAAHFAVMLADGGGDGDGGGSAGPGVGLAVEVRQVKQAPRFALAARVLAVCARSPRHEIPAAAVSISRAAAPGGGLRRGPALRRAAAADPRRRAE